jgi:hypothetical protein
MVCPSCTHREPSASFAVSGVKPQAKSRITIVGRGYLEITIPYFSQMAKVEQGEVRRIHLPRTPVNNGKER